MTLPPQVPRLAVVFALATAALVGARSFLVPATFGRFGHYRAAAVDSIAARPVHYAGRRSAGAAPAVVVVGQLFFKSLRGLTVYKVELLGAEGLATTIGLLALPFLILWVLVKVLPPWADAEARSTA